VLFSKDKEFDKYADTVIKKPFVLRDLIDGLNNNTLLPKVNRKECIKFREYSLFPIKKEITSSVLNKTIKLTEREVDILKYLYQNSDIISTKENLLENVWGYSADVTTHTIETHIYRLRQKVEEDGGSQLIITENNGYRLNI
jgi:DNA-binding response OmpR family regulator